MDGADAEGTADEELAGRIVKYRFRDSPEPLQEALSTAISFRRRRFRDWRRHHDRMVKREEKTAAPIIVKEIQESGKTERRPKAAKKPKLKDIAKGEQICGNPTVNTDLEPEPSLNPSRQSFRSANFRPPESISNSTGISFSVRTEVGGLHVDWPRPPRPIDGVARCPYCFALLDPAEVRSKTKWR